MNRIDAQVTTQKMRISISKQTDTLIHTPCCRHTTLDPLDSRSSRIEPTSHSHPASAGCELEDEWKPF